MMDGAWRPWARPGHWKMTDIMTDIIVIMDWRNVTYESPWRTRQDAARQDNCPTLMVLTQIFFQSLIILFWRNYVNFPTSVAFLLAQRNQSVSLRGGNLNPKIMESSDAWNRLVPLDQPTKTMGSQGEVSGSETETGLLRSRKGFILSFIICTDCWDSPMPTARGFFLQTFNWKRKEMEHLLKNMSKYIVVYLFFTLVSFKRKYAISHTIQGKN